jgi:putative endopeptidase
MKNIRLLLRTFAAVAVVALMGSMLSARAASPIVYSVKPGIDLANLDTTCKACDDFYQFATGGWQKAHPIPAAYPAWGTFNILNDDNQNVEHEILEDAARNTAAKPGSNEQKIGSYYRSCMNEAGVEAAGVSALKPELDRIAAMTTPASVITESAHLGTIGVSAGLGLGVTSDQKDSTVQEVQIGGGGTGLPDRDYYLKDDDRFKAVRAAYVSYIATTLGFLGDDPAKAQSEAQAILALETVVAKATPPREELRDSAKYYHPTPFTDLPTALPGIDWPAFFAASGVPVQQTVNITLFDPIKAGIGLYTSVPVDTWKAYDRFHLVSSYANTLPKQYVDASFAFSSVFSGAKEQLPRWKRCAGAVNGALGEALGDVYVQKTFPPAAKKRALDMVNNLQGVLADDIKTLAWMSAPTKARAEIKLAAFTKKIGYPDKFTDYSSLTISDDSYTANVMRARIFDDRREVSFLGKPTDRTLWGMTPPTVNAYYNPSNNEIVFPAGILHPPFFSDENDDAVNYGAVGAVIGHEMTHGFDDQGRRYDENGNRVDWWTPADATNFTERAQCIIDEYNAFEVVPGVHEKGINVQGEAVADLGGITIAYKAFERTPEFKSTKKLEGYTPQQRFFLAYAQVWASQERDAAKSAQAQTDPHPEAKFRVIGTLSNMPEFKKAFACMNTDKMVRAKQCQIW